MHCIYSNLVTWSGWYMALKEYSLMLSSNYLWSVKIRKRSIEDKIIVILLLILKYNYSSKKKKEYIIITNVWITNPLFFHECNSLYLNEIRNEITFGNGWRDWMFQKESHDRNLNFKSESKTLSLLSIIPAFCIWLLFDLLFLWYSTSINFHDFIRFNYFYSCLK